MKRPKGVRRYGATVLLIDDQPIIAEVVKRALTGEKDITLHYCRDPKDALKMAKEIKPTLIIQDLVLPDIDGLTMVALFREDAETARIPIIVLSTKEEPEVKSKAFAVGVNDYIVKLPDRIELIARIRYHSQAYINQKQRDEAFRALQESQRRLAAANEILLKLSVLDGLTGIPNRRRFDDVLQKEWRRAMRHGRALSLLLIDIDYFKSYNDSLGHISGDDCLIRVAETLEHSISREADMVARYGGEEFAAVLPETGLQGAVDVGEVMRRNVELLRIPHPSSPICDYVTISVGVASAIPETEDTPEGLIAAADQALYNAKKDGRNRIRIVDYRIA